MKAIVVKEFSFDSAHYLPGYNGPCQFLHGHHYVLQVGYNGEVNLKTGMVVDFKDIKREVDPLIDELDHSCLNECKLVDFPKQLPTAENMVEWFVHRLEISNKLCFVRLYETPTSYAEWRKD